MMKVPYMFVVGEKEVNERKVAVRKQGKGDEGAKDLSEIISILKNEIVERQ
jgi:threonyl-tRNA synthetase